MAAVVVVINLMAVKKMVVNHFQVGIPDGSAADIAGGHLWWFVGLGGAKGRHDLHGVVGILHKNDEERDTFEGSFWCIRGSHSLIRHIIDDGLVGDVLWPVPTLFN